VTRKGTEPGLQVVLLAGGSGTRFWPLSRTDHPKQFLPLGGKASLLVETWKRVRRLVPAKNIWVVAPDKLAAKVRKTLPSLGRSRLILEPSPRDTAPAIALGCATLSRRDPESVVAVFPTDHVVRDLDAFTRSVRSAVRAARTGALVCLGIRPDRPATGFGYLKCAERPRGTRPVTVEKFVEKPQAARARRFVDSGRYLWNAGMFVWRVDRFLEELAARAPRVRRAVEGHLDGKSAAWGRAPKISVDYAVMEKASRVEVVPLDAGWDDVGSWAAAARLREEFPGKRGRHILIDSEGSVVFGDNRLVAVVDAPGLVVVDTDDAILIVPRERAQRVREIVRELKRSRRKGLL
jgi:mannose-1-phosphate guanylyltransferase/mannose-6-phosphate isomerase